MAGLKLLILLACWALESSAQSQFNPSFGTPPNSQYGNQNNPQYGNQYNPQYNQTSPFGNPNNPQYGNQNQYNPQYGNQSSQFGNPNNPPYGNQNQYNPQYGNQSSQFGNPNNPPYGNQNQYNPQYGNQNGYSNSSQYGNQGPPYNNGQNRPPFGNQDPQFGNLNNQYGNQNNPNNPQYGNQGPPYNTQGSQYGNQGSQYGNQGSQYGNQGSQYGNNNNGDDNNYGNSNQQDNCCQDYCYATDENKYLNFATKTAYQVVYGKQSNQHRIPDCEAVQFWSINRDGTRYPGSRTIPRLRELSRIRDEIVRNYDQRRSYPDKGRLCPQDFDLLKRWRWNETINEGRANALTEQGITDLKFLARRYHSRFENIFREPYSERTYNFQYTDTDRTHDSYQAYIEGLFRNNAFQVHANVFPDDRLIESSKMCRAWQREVDQNPDSMQEYMRFKRKQDYQQMVRDVFRRLGFRYTLNDSIIEDMYDLCRYEKAWDLDHNSAWCAVFNKEQLKILEYAEDLKYYYKTGYGNDINRKMGCPPVKNLFEKFQKTVDQNSDGNKVTVFFTHSVTIQTFLTAMGIARDYQALTADNYYQQTRRQWRTSTIDPFASNLAAALYECRSGEKHRVMFFLNEVPVNYPDCAVGLCDWSIVKMKLERVAQECNLDFCDDNAAAGLKTNHHVVLVLSLTAAFLAFTGRC